MSPIRPSSMNLAKNLMQVLKPEQLGILQSIARHAVQEKAPIYIVGGFVRDLLLGKPGFDFDLVVEGDAIAAAQTAAQKFGGRLIVHARFKTAQWFPPPHTGMPRIVDFITARSETYKHPGALPTIRPGSLVDDLERRDFSINTLAVRLDGDRFGELRNDLDGLQDLRAGIIRVLHADSFKDDPTRLLRAVRYEQRYKFKIHDDTLLLVPGALKWLNRLSAERIRHELDLALEEQVCEEIISRLGDLGILTAIHPALNCTESAKVRMGHGQEAGFATEHNLSKRNLHWALWLMEFPTASVRSIDKRMHFEARLREMILASSRLFSGAPGIEGKRASQCTAWLDEFPLRAVQAARIGLGDGPGSWVFQEYLTHWRHVKPHTSGHDLKEKGLVTGPAFGRILNRLRAAWLDGEIGNKTEEFDLLDNLVRREKKTSGKAE